MILIKYKYIWRLVKLISKHTHASVCTTRAIHSWPYNVILCPGGPHHAPTGTPHVDPESIWIRLQKQPPLENTSSGAYALSFYLLTCYFFKSFLTIRWFFCVRCSFFPICFAAFGIGFAEIWMYYFLKLPVGIVPAYFTTACARTGRRWCFCRCADFPFVFILLPKHLKHCFFSLVCFCRCANFPFCVLFLSREIYINASNMYVCAVDCVTYMCVIFLGCLMRLYHTSILFIFRYLKKSVLKKSVLFLFGNFFPNFLLYLILLFIIIIFNFSLFYFGLAERLYDYELYAVVMHSGMSADHGTPYVLMFFPTIIMIMIMIIILLLRLLSIINYYYSSSEYY